MMENFSATAGGKTLFAMPRIALLPFRRPPRARRREPGVLRCCGCAWRDRGGSTDQDFERVSTGTAVERPRSHDQDGEGARAATLEEEDGLPAASSGRERLLPVQINYRNWPSNSEDATRYRRPGRHCPAAALAATVLIRRFAGERSARDELWRMPRPAACLPGPKNLQHSAKLVACPCWKGERDLRASPRHGIRAD